MAASTQEKIAERAFQLYQQRGGQNGSDFDDWLQAEQEIVGERKSSTSNKQRVEKAVAKPPKAKAASVNAKKTVKKAAAPKKKAAKKSSKK